MKQISIMLKPASSACNLRCRYCFYADLAEQRDTFCFGSMTGDTVDRILRKLSTSLEPGDGISFAFQGGEPTLVGLPWYRDFVEKADRVLSHLHLSYALQTNGTRLDDDWGDFLHQRNFLVGLSIDSLPKYHNACRPDARGGDTYGLVMDAVHLLRKHRVEFNVLCTLTAEISRHPSQVYQWIVKNDFRYVQFTPCLDALDSPGKSPYALHPDKFASFYVRIFDLWLEDFRKGNYRSIKLFDDIVNLLAYGRPTACGIHGRCQCQLVVEADGSVYPCDFYCLDPLKLGNLMEDSWSDMVNSEIARSFVNRPRDGMEICSTCPYGSFCGGGCRRMQREVFCEPGGKTCGYRSLLDHAMPALQRIAMDQLRYRRG